MQQEKCSQREMKFSKYQRKENGKKKLKEVAFLKITHNNICTPTMDAKDVLTPIMGFEHWFPERTSNIEHRVM